VERSNFDLLNEKAFFEGNVLKSRKKCLVLGKGFQIPVETQLGKEKISGI